MTAAVLISPRIIELQEVPSPQPKENEVLIQVKGCGICTSSLPLWEGREWFQYPAEPGSPGHEGWGVVTAAGPVVTKVAVGDPVAFLSFHAYAEYDVAAEDALVKLPEALRNKPFPGEPLGCALNIFERSHISEGDTVAIVGAGFLGVLLCRLAKNKGAMVIAISRRLFSLDYAKQAGADETIPLTSTWEVGGKVSELTGGAFCTHVIEATGKQEGLDIATEIVAEGGRMIIAGYHQDGLRQINVQKWNWKGIDVINAHERDPKKYLTGMQKAGDAVVSGAIDPTPLYTNMMGIDALNRGFELTHDRPDGFMKALVTF